jgi:signal transduction histidine kinase
MVRAVSPDHIVQFYETDKYVCEVAGRFVAEGLRLGQSVVVIVTPQHSDLISAALQTEGVMPEAAILSGQLVLRDARSTLATFMKDKRPDSGRFNECIGGLLDEVRKRRPGMAIRAFGEMVDLLCRDGNPGGAMELEALWNQLATIRRFVLLCAYHIGNFREEAQSTGFRSVCDEHAFVLPTEKYLEIQAEEARLREISRLQQRAEVLESALAESREANRIKDEFLATVSHELRTPLNAMLGWTRLAWNSSDPKLVQHAFEVIDRNGKAQLRLIEDLLDVSRIISGKMAMKNEPVDLVDLMTTAINSVRTAADAKGIALDLNVPDTLPSIAGDPGRLHQVLWNLLSNAVKFTPPKGRVDVRAERVDFHVEITVCDTGVGIASEFLPHVFERFRQVSNGTTRESGGLGLGLSIVRYLVEAHGGCVRAESPGTGLGATFTIELPLKAAIGTAAVKW